MVIVHRAGLEAQGRRVFASSTSAFLGAGPIPAGDTHMRCEAFPHRRELISELDMLKYDS